MGYIRHQAIIVTGEKSRVTKAHKKAGKLGLRCTEIVASTTNGYFSFLIVPDGSKLGWETSNQAEELRENWIYWVSFKKENFVDWALVWYGGDEPRNAHLVDSNKN